MNKKYFELREKKYLKLYKKATQEWLYQHWGTRHIEKGYVGNPQFCPVASTINKETGKRYLVGAKHVFDGSEIVRNLPTSVTLFVRNFDYGCYPELRS